MSTTETTGTTDFFPSQAESDVDQISGRFIAADFTVHFRGAWLHVTAGGPQNGSLHRQPPITLLGGFNIHTSRLHHRRLGGQRRAQDKKKSTYRRFAPLLFQPCPSRPRCYKVTKQDGRVEHVAVREPPKATIPLSVRQSSPAALIPAPLVFHPPSFVVANSSMWTLHAPAETRRACGYRGSIHCCPAGGAHGWLPCELCGVPCRLRCQINSDDSPAASAIRALQQQRHYFSCMASTTASRRMTCAPLLKPAALKVYRRRSLVTLVPRLSMTGRRGMDIWIFSHERFDPAQKPRRPAAG
jgi:hypothetical protein